MFRIIDAKHVETLNPTTVVGLTEEERYAVADHSVAQLKERGDPWRLNEEAPTAKPPST